MDFRKRKRRLKKKVGTKIRDKHLVKHKQKYVEFLVDHGIRLTPSGIDDPTWVCEGARTKLCFETSLHRVLVDNGDNPNVVYMEGLAVCDGTAILHGWVYDISTETLIDPMLDKTCGVVDYIGVMFSDDYLISILGSLANSTIIQNWKDGFPLLNNKIPEGAIIKLNKEGK